MAKHDYEKTKINATRMLETCAIIKGDKPCKFEGKWCCYTFGANVCKGHNWGKKILRMYRKEYIGARDYQNAWRKKGVRTNKHRKCIKAFLNLRVIIEFLLILEADSSCSSR